MMLTMAKNISMPIITRFLMKASQKREAAEILGVNPETLRRWGKSGKLKPIIISTRGDRRYKREDIERLVKKLVDRDLTKPKLLFYGTRDEFTAPEKVKEVYEAIPEPKMIHELDTDHDYRYQPKIIEEVNEVVGQFLDNYIRK